MDKYLLDEWGVMREWNVLRVASERGWIDPGQTEPLEVTVKRAQDYLDALPGSGPAPDYAEG